MFRIRQVPPSLLLLILAALALLASPALRAAEGSPTCRVGFATPYHVVDSQITRDAVRTADGVFTLLAGTGYPVGRPGVGVLVKASAIGPEWMNVYGGEFDHGFTGIAELADGTLVASGYAFDSIYSTDQRLWIIKLDPNGGILWEKTFGLPNEQTGAYAMTRTTDGGFIVASLRLRFQSPVATPMTWVLKLDADGNVEWDRTFSGGVAHAILETADGSYLLSGGQPIPGSLYSRVWALKIDRRGRAIWERVYDRQIYVLLESGLAEAPGGSLISGKEFLQKIGPNGDLLWIRDFPGLTFNTLAVLADGRIAAGGTDVATNNEHAYVTVMSPEGDKLIWANSELLSPSGFTRIIPLQSSRTAGLIFAGWAPADAQGLSFDLLVGSLWEY